MTIFIVPVYRAVCANVNENKEISRLSRNVERLASYAYMVLRRRGDGAFDLYLADSRCLFILPEEVISW
jgi:hypothetical protein